MIETELSRYEVPNTAYLMEDFYQTATLEALEKAVFQVGKKDSAHGFSRFAFLPSFGTAVFRRV